MSTATTQIIISGKDQLSGVVADAGRRLGTELEGMKRQVLGLNAVMAGLAGYFTGGALAANIKDVSMLAARYDTLGVVMGVVGNNAGYTRQEMDRFEAQLRKTGITAIESRNNLASMASANMDLSKAAELARMAQDAAVIGNMNSSEAFKQMIYGIKSAQVEVLRTIGINVNFEQSYKRMAEQLGKNKDELTEAEKMQARLNAVLEQAPTIAGVYEESLTTVGKKLASLARLSEDARVKLGAVFQPSMALLVDTYTSALQALNLELDNTAVIERWARAIKSEILDIMQMGAALNMVMGKAGQAASIIGMGVYGPGAALGIENSEKGFEYFAQSYLDYQKQFADSEAYLNKLIAEQERLASTVRTQTQDYLSEQARIAAGNARRAQQAAAELVAGKEADPDKLKRAKEKALREAMERNALEPYEATQFEQMNKGDMFYGLAEANKRASSMLETQARENLQLQTEFSEKYREVVLGETEFKKAQIEAQAEAYRKAGSDEIAIKQWVEAEKLKVSRDWQDGASRALREYVDEATNMAASVEAAVTNGFKGMEDALVDFVATGKLSFSDFADSVVRDLARIAIQQSITGPLAAGAGDWLSSLFSGGSSMGAGTLSSMFSRNAAGGVFVSPGLSAYSGQIVSTPTVFPFARGVGLMGEAGPEAIMPLQRGPDGVLGVRGGGGGVVVNVIESPGSGGRQEQRTENGVNILDVYVEQIKAAVASDISSGRGAIPAALSRTYGVSRAQGALR